MHASKPWRLWLKICTIGRQDVVTWQRQINYWIMTVTELYLFKELQNEVPWSIWRSLLQPALRLAMIKGGDSGKLVHCACRGLDILSQSLRQSVLFSPYLLYRCRFISGQPCILLAPIWLAFAGHVVFWSWLPRRGRGKAPVHSEIQRKICDMLGISVLKVTKCMEALEAVCLNKHDTLKVWRWFLNTKCKLSKIL